MKLKEIRIDGYKNLIDCCVPLGDFNVVVGPNNSGKSNLLEFFELLCTACFAGENLTSAVLRGYPARVVGSSIPRMPAFADRPLTLGISFETVAGGAPWIAHYDLTVRRNPAEHEAAGFVSEVLRAKIPSKTGKPRKYIDRQGKSLKLMGKVFPIEEHTSSLSALRILRPGFQGLPPEFSSIYVGIWETALTCVYALSPDALRCAMREEGTQEGSRVSSFNLLDAIDEIHGDHERFASFKETICGILELQNLAFTSVSKPKPRGSSERDAAPGRVKYCYLKDATGKYADLREFSDGTISVVAIVAAAYTKERIGPLMVIEELENSLHPASLERMLRFLKERAEDSPALITTHSPYLLNGVDPGDVIVAVTDDTGAAHFEKPEDRKAINRLLKEGYMSFGDLLVTNFQGVLGRT